MSTGQVRTAHIGAALESYRSLQERLPTLTRAEVEHALNVELATARRQSVLNVLVTSATQKYRDELIAKTNPTKEHPHG